MYANKTWLDSCLPRACLDGYTASGMQQASYSVSNAIPATDAKQSKRLSCRNVAE
jgi:hypothetical protein